MILCYEKMLKMKNPFIIIISVVLFQAFVAVSVVVPSTGCYALDNSSHIYDFSSWIGQPFEHEDMENDLVIRFCKDVETRSQKGYVDFGRFDKLNNFHAGSGAINFVQEYYNGDLTSCEQSYDKLGRTAQVNIVCGDCPNGKCKGAFGCICNVTNESNCRVLVQLAIPCEKAGPRVFQGFTVGFHPRAWEIVYNGLTQLGYEKAHSEFSFKTEQTQLALHMTSISSVSNLVKKPIIQIYPEQGLEVKLSGSGATGGPPTTLSPTVLIIDWRCEQVRDTPYAVNVTIPIESYDPIQFTLTKICDYKQSESGDATIGWAIFGIFSCIFVVVSTLICCGGFIYKTRVLNQHGVEALPGITIFSTFLETASGGVNKYSRPEDVNSSVENQAAWDRQFASSSSQASWTASERNYGSV